ncbi:glycosyltransferase family 8 protein [Mesorhizobium sp. B2-1-8]|uniref:glycosyltransferase family 8 protein n=1 Tax=unclassified Mesorhizobium TaxID=325217 RepID=UPI0015E2D830|nr:MULTISPECIES: glycosyltransferase family 8 protein [unclassified Mesorhizobium]MBZ9670876.1 glycosyltransferase family 8 protein [Mesorhizobium sp. ES1-3]UCI21945.1 glycosyltransferase family 8 protein [Mesorhizobium sp. B2-1-8]
MIIVTASDDNFVPGLFVLVYSAWLHNRTAKFFVIDAGIGLASAAEFRRFCERNGIDCELVQADCDRISNLPTRGKLTAAAYARLLIPEILPDCDKAIYLDADTLVVSDLRDLWSVDLGDNLVAGVVDGFVEQEELDDVGLVRDEYINSGVLAINLDAWRREGIADRIFAKAKETVSSRYLDQTVLNSVSRGRVHYLAREWNFFSERYVQSERRLPKVIHYAGSAKPWRYKRVPFAEVFNSYRIMSGSNVPAATAATKSVRARKIILGLIGLRRKYWSSLLASVYYRRRFTKPHLRRLEEIRQGGASA